MNASIVIVVYCTLIGLILGSFITCLAYRLAEGKSVVTPARSFCPRCDAQLAWYENLPIISYIIQKGRCRHCGASIPARYLAVEIVMGLGGMALAFKATSVAGWGLGMAALFLMTTAAAMEDITGRVPLFVRGWLAVIALALAVHGGSEAVRNVIAGGAVGAAALVLFPGAIDQVGRTGRGVGWLLCLSGAVIGGLAGQRQWLALAVAIVALMWPVVMARNPRHARPHPFSVYPVVGSLVVLVLS